MTQLEGRTIAVAGAAGGLGPTVARRLAAAGASLALTDVDAGRLNAVAAGLDLPEERLDCRVVDLLDDTPTRAWVDHLEQRFGGTDALVHLVGGWRGGEGIATTPLADYEFLHDLLVRTVQLTTRAFHSALTASGNGRFVLVSAAAAQDPESTNAAYASTKASAEAWTLALADSFSGTGATANIIVINAIETPAMRDESPGVGNPSFTPAEHIAEALVFICSEAGARMNGQRLELRPRG